MSVETALLDCLWYRDIYILLNLRFINANQPSEGKKSMKVLVL